VILPIIPLALLFSLLALLAWKVVKIEKHLYIQTPLMVNEEEEEGTIIDHPPYPINTD